MENTLVNTTTNDTVQEVSRFALSVGISMAALVGVWGTACLVSAISAQGPIALVRSYFTAVIG